MELATSVLTAVTQWDAPDLIDGEIEIKADFGLDSCESGLFFGFWAIKGVDGDFLAILR